MNSAPPPPVVAQPSPYSAPPPEPSKEEPWGLEDPLLWCARRVRLHALWGSSVIALLVLLFGVGMYVLFTAAIFEGNIEGEPMLILLLLTPFILAIVGAVATGALARNVGRLAKQPLAPPGASTARGVLWFSVLLWVMLLVMFPVSLTITTDGGDEPFPIGILTVLPVYIGFCVAIYTTGAAYAAWSESNKAESLLVIGLAWAAFGMFLLLPSVISSWNLGSADPDIDWNSAVWWLRFGNLFPAIAPWLIVAGLYFIHNRSIAILEDRSIEDVGPPPYGVNAGATSADACPNCGSRLSEHPKTLEVFCAACGWGLSPEQQAPVVVDTTPAPTHADDMFVEQGPASTAPATAAGPVMFCTGCGERLPQDAKRFCTSCGARIPGRAEEPSTASEEPKPPVSFQVPSPVISIVPETPAAPTTVEPEPVTPRQEPAPSNCPLCGAPVAVHPRTGERFCPACGAGLRSDG
ncbi:MAG: zinc ribbon domain-containing protein [Thermoplasmata archaeon]|nr:MAG: zinc ribbon domain-containing protein [Thermoplasmata archaeon]